MLSKGETQDLLFDANLVFISYCSYMLFLYAPSAVIEDQKDEQLSLISTHRFRA